MASNAVEAIKWSPRLPPAQVIAHGHHSSSSSRHKFAQLLGLLPSRYALRRDKVWKGRLRE